MAITVATVPPVGGLNDSQKDSKFEMVKMGLRVFDSSWGKSAFHSASFREITLTIFGTNETMTFPAQVCTKAGDVRAAIAKECMMEDASRIIFVVKQGAYMKKLEDRDEITSKVMVKGIKTFKPQPAKWKHPWAVLGAGYNGVKMGLVMAHDGFWDWTMYDRRDRVGGTAWLQQANKTSKLQTDLAAFHVWFGPEWDDSNSKLSYPVDWSSWPKKDEVIAHMQHAVDRYGLAGNILLRNDVTECKVVGKLTDMDRYYQLKIKDLKKNTESESSAQCIMHFPGAYFTPRQIIYPGEETFGGAIGFGMADDIPFDHLGGNRVAILGNGAFAVENIRTCMEYGAAKVYQVCRKKNLASPRMVCWFVHQAIVPVPAGMLLDCCRKMYDCGDFGEPWNFHSVYGNRDKGVCTISSNSRFGIGDVTFLATATGRCEYVVDTVKRCAPNTLHLNGGGKLDDIQVIVKALGLLADFNCDKMHNIKEMIGLYPAGDHRRNIYCDALGMHANNFTTKSTGGPSYAFTKVSKYFMDFPKEYPRIHDGIKDLVPRSVADENKPACQYSSQYSMTCNGIILGCVPRLAAALDTDDYMHKVVTACYPLEKYYEECVHSWNQYQMEWKAQGFEHEYIPYPYTRDDIEDWFGKYVENVGPRKLEDKQSWWAGRTHWMAKQLEEFNEKAKVESKEWWKENCKSW